MGANSKIEWTHHTFNPWRGCTKVSAGCANCYAERQSLRNPKVLGIWGDDGNRVIAAESYWQQPLKWNAAAQAAGERHRVFCASLADIFEDRDELVEPRCRLFDLIDDTDNLDWLLLTKRPENFIAFLPGSWREYPRRNVWLGVSVEDQKNADERIPQLLATPAHIRFLSVEPLLGPINLPIRTLPPVLNRYGEEFLKGPSYLDGIAWVIAGGESGPRARPMHPDWARRIRDDCNAAGVAFHFKQWGEWCPADGFPYPKDEPPPKSWLKTIVRLDPAIETPTEVMLRCGKHAAGRLLDGREWNEFPKAVALEAR